jgi:hypothetical protein
MTITYRAAKGSALLYGELDENFRDLREDTDLQRVLTNGNTSTLSLTSLNVTATDTVTANSKVIIQQNTTPSSATATGTKGTIVWDSNYIYVCVSTNTWKRASLNTW